MKLSEKLSKLANEFEEISKEALGIDQDNNSQKALHYFQEQSAVLVQLANKVEELEKNQQTDHDKIEELQQNLIDLEAEIPAPDDEDITAPEEENDSSDPLEGRI